MLFNSLEFLLLFFPIVLFIALILRGRSLVLWICITSTFFYAYAGHAWFLVPMFISATLDFWVGGKLESSTDIRRRKILLWISVTANLGLLAYFKYSGFFLDSVHSLFVMGGYGKEEDILLAGWRVILPAGISFYTFQTLSYVIDIYRKDGHQEKSYSTYFAFVAFFPHLVAGPLTRHNQLIPQIQQIAKNGIHPRWTEGIFLFSVGLAKKVLIADRVANLIDPLIHQIDSIGAIEAWLAIFGYAFQIYFDFSGYSDMAIGLGRLMQIELPQNFNSPYKSLSPSDFWRRWHMTLSLWLRDYLYIPLGGNRCSANRQKMNLMLTMMLGGLWHGASWNFLFWGIYHGGLLLLYHQYEAKWQRIPKSMQRCLMFLLICMGWVFFRAPNLQSALHWYEALFFMRGIAGSITLASMPLILVLAVGFLITFGCKNSMEINWNLKPATCVALGAVTAVCILLMNYSSRFLYFQF